jgi:dipicolinate synthase subunit A
MTVLLLGGDSRQIYAGQELTRLGYSTRYAEAEGDSLAGALGGADILLLPTPATRDGVHLNCALENPPAIRDIAAVGPGRIFGGGFSADFVRGMRRDGREVTDLLAVSSFTEQNAALTAEAALGIGMRACGESMSGLPVSVIGYGRIASRLTRLLLLLGARVKVFARSEEARLTAQLDGAEPHDTACLRLRLAPSRLLFNTAPAPLLDRHTTELLSDCAIVELASGRENITISAQAKNVTLTFAHSLPGKIFPVSAGRIIARTLDQTIQKEGFKHK